VSAVRVALNELRKQDRPRKPHLTDPRRAEAVVAQFTVTEDFTRSVRYG
jgi:hypothetical protein